MAAVAIILSRDQSQNRNIHPHRTPPTTAPNRMATIVVQTPLDEPGWGWARLPRKLRCIHAPFAPFLDSELIAISWSCLPNAIRQEPANDLHRVERLT